MILSRSERNALQAAISALRKKDPTFSLHMETVSRLHAEKLGCMKVRIYDEPYSQSFGGGGELYVDNPGGSTTIQPDWVTKGRPDIVENTEQRKETVKHPAHYNKLPSGIECIDVVEWFNFNKGNAIKYVWRAGHKNDEIEDLRKAIFYLEAETDKLQRERNGES